MTTDSTETTVTIQQLKWGKGIIAAAMELPKKQQYAALTRLEQTVGERVYREMRNYYEQTEWWKRQCEEEERKGNLSAKAAELRLTKLETEMVLGWDVLWKSQRDPKTVERKKVEPEVVKRELSKGAAQVSRIATSNLRVSVSDDFDAVIAAAAERNAERR